MASAGDLSLRRKQQQRRLERRRWTEQQRFWPRSSSEGNMLLLLLHFGFCWHRQRLRRRQQRGIEGGSFYKNLNGIATSAKLQAGVLRGRTTGPLVARPLVMYYVQEMAAEFSAGTE